MKRFLLMLCLLVSIVCSFTACGSSNRVPLDCYGYACVIDYDKNIFSIDKGNENLAEIPFTLTVDGNVYQCEVFFPDGSSYWEKQKLQNGMNMVIMPKVGEDFGYSDGYVENKQLIKGDYLADEIIENYERAQVQTSSVPIGRILIFAVIVLFTFCAV